MVMSLRLVRLLKKRSPRGRRARSRRKDQKAHAERRHRAAHAAEEAARRVREERVKEQQHDGEEHIVVDDVRQRVADLRVEQDLDNAKELVGQQRQHEQIDDKEDRPRDALVWFMWEVAAFFAMWMDPFCLFRG